MKRADHKPRLTESNRQAGSVCEYPGRDLNNDIVAIIRFGLLLQARPDLFLRFAS